MPKKRQATLTLDGPEDQTVTFLADFEQLTLTRTQVGGYQREPNGTQPITPAAAESFWKQLEGLAAKGLRDGPFDTLDAVVWKFTACDGKKTYEATGLVRDSSFVIDDDRQADDSYAEIVALFASLKQ
jgi:hypothetical protein